MELYVEVVVEEEVMILDVDDGAALMSSKRPVSLLPIATT
jgi:hypothetical protein